MIGYTLLGSNNLERAIGFYDVVLGELGAKKSFDMGERGQAYSNGKGAMLGVCTPYDGGAATTGNGTMVALVAPDRAAVDRVHAAALASGATDEGARGELLRRIFPRSRRQQALRFQDGMRPLAKRDVSIHPVRRVQRSERG